MNNQIELNVRVFPVTVRDGRNGEVSESTVVLTKEQLHAAQLLGQGVNELLSRVYGRQGYRVQAIGKPVKKTMLVDLYAHDGKIIVDGDSVHYADQEAPEE